MANQEVPIDFADLIGVPFQYGGRGPARFDCYGLIMDLHRRQGKSLPDFGFASDQALVAAMMGATLPQWKEVKQRPGAVVLIRVGRYVAHVGYMINQYQMIHTWEHSGGVSIVQVESWKQRIVGFYEYVGH